MSIPIPAQTPADTIIDRLNSREHIRDRLASIDKGWNSIHITSDNAPKKIQGQTSLAAVDFEMNHVGDCSLAAITL
jgi:hypothetical protein